ncbi:MAG: YsnF/AvaK domain-containing protein, partial [Nitrososphaera sp.]
VQELGQNYVQTQKGLISKEKFYIPKSSVEGFDGNTLWFNASQDQLEGWKRDSPPGDNEYSQNKTQETPSDVETRIPLIEERLNVSKSTSTSEATITKEPVTETKTVEVPVTHDELTVERRPAGESSSTTTERPVQSKTDTKVQLSKEEVQVTKEPYVKEEVVVKKKPVTETRTVSDTVTSERINMSGTAADLQANTGMQDNADDGRGKEY